MFDVAEADEVGNGNITKRLDLADRVVDALASGQLEHGWSKLEQHIGVDAVDVAKRFLVKGL